MRKARLYFVNLKTIIFILFLIYYLKFKFQKNLNFEGDFIWDFKLIRKNARSIERFSGNRSGLMPACGVIEYGGRVWLYQK